MAVKIGVKQMQLLKYMREPGVEDVIEDTISDL